jgi:hypothetical protein
VALRKLFAVAMVLGGTLAVGCGGATGKSAFDPVDDEPPNNATDQPPANPDRPSGNTDRPPSSNPDRPPSNPDSPGGGRIQELCDKLCQVVDRCDTGMNMGDTDVGALCEMGFCTIPAGTPVQVPCLDEIIGLFDCALSLPDLCAAEDSSQAAANQQACRDPFEGFGTCFENEYGTPIDNPGDDDGDDDDDEPPTQASCTQAGGCQNCASDCLSCYCQIADDATPDPMECNEECMLPTP